jgi:hypothetical protein
MREPNLLNDNRLIYLLNIARVERRDAYHHFVEKRAEAVVVHREAVPRLEDHLGGHVLW